MGRRIAALVIALTVASAPAALTVCELLCAAHDVQPSHACHETERGETAALTGAVHACGHDDAMPDASRTVTPQSPLVLAVADVASPESVHVQGVALPVPAVAPTLSNAFKLKTQLRI